MGRFASWQRPRLSTVMMVLIPALVIVLIGAGVVHQNSSPSKALSVHSAPRHTVSVAASAHPTPITPPAPKPGAVAPSTAPPVDDFSPIGTVSLDAATGRNITAAVKVWAGFPSHAGAAAILAKLRLNSSVSAAALSDLARQWAKPVTNPVDVTVGGVVMFPSPSFATATQATFTGTVVQHKLYSDGKVTNVLTDVDVQLTKVGDGWQIARIEAL